MKIEKETQEKLQELQMIEANLQNVLLQEQAFQQELQETESALEEIKNSEGEIFKIIGNIMLKSNKENTSKDLKEKQEILSMRIKSLEKQERSLSEKQDVLKSELENFFKNNKE